MLDVGRWTLDVQARQRRGGPLSRCLLVALLVAAGHALPAADLPGKRPAPVGKFGRAVDIANMPLRTRSLETYGRFPLTVELWCKLPGEKMQRFHLLAANAPGRPAAHWEIYSTPLQGHLTATISAVEPRQIESFVRITDDQWHHVALTCDGRSAALYLDGREVARQDVKPATPAKEPAKEPRTEDLELFVGSDVPQNTAPPLPALVDELRISSTVRPVEARRIDAVPAKPLEADEHTAGLWHFDEETGNRRGDASRADNALAYSPGISSAWTPRSSQRPDAEAWEKATDDDWLDGRVNQMDKGPFWGCSMSVPAAAGNKQGPYAAKGMVLRLGDDGDAAVLFDRGLLQMPAAWTGGYLHIPDRRFGLIEHPQLVGNLVFSTPTAPGWDPPATVKPQRDERWAPLPKEWARYQGAYLHGRRTILAYTVGGIQVYDLPWTRKAGGLTAVSRTLQIAARTAALRLHVLEGTPLRQSTVNGLPVITWRPDKARGAKDKKATSSGAKASETKANEAKANEAKANEAKANDVQAVALWPPDDSVRLELEQNQLRLVARRSLEPAVTQLFYWRGAAADLPKFAALVLDSPRPERIETLSPERIGGIFRIKRTGLTAGGPPRWTKEIVTTVGHAARVPADGHASRVSHEPTAHEPFALDTLTLPYDNPYGSIFFVTGLGFLRDGRIAISTIYGDVWFVGGEGGGPIGGPPLGGADDKPGRLTWKRFASGMYQPLGMVVRTGDLKTGVPDAIYVLERGQITRLRDLNGDDEADVYENFYNGWQTTGSGHAYDTALKLGADGAFYFFKGQTPEADCRESGCLVRVSPTAAAHEVFATGFRHPIGLGIDPILGTITGGDQQGNWVPATRIDQYHRGGFYGDMRTHHRDKPPTDFDKPICWLPQYVDSSAGGQVWVPRETWGPLGGGLLHLSWGRCTVHWLMRQTIEGQGGSVVQGGIVQGGVVRLPIPKLLSGPITGAFNPRDGQLYVVGLHGWQTAGEKDGCLQRVRYTGAKVHLPLELLAREDGLEARFNEPLDKAAAADVKNYSIEEWNYRYSEQYGSDHWSVVDPDRMGHDAVKIAEVVVSASGRSVLLRVPDLKPAMQVKLTYRLKAADGTPVEDTIHHTIHKLAPK